MVKILKDPIIIGLFAASIIALVVSIFIGFGALNVVSGDFIINFDVNKLPITGGQNAVRNIIIIFSAIFVINTVLAYELFFRDRILSYLVSAVTVIVSLIMVASLYKIALLN